MANPFPEFLDDNQKRQKATNANPFPDYLHAEPGMVDKAMDFVSGFGDVIDQGWSVGGADELGAAIQAGARTLTGSDQTFGELYDERLKRNQGDLREFREDHPVASVVGEIAGAAPTAALGASGLIPTFGTLGFVRR